MTSPSPAIADTSALSALCRIGRLEILRWRFLPVIVPHAVRVELEASDDKNLTAMIDQACEAGWMRIADPSISDWQAPISRLGPGETAALALAVAMPEAVLLMDERRGRRAARMLGLRRTRKFGHEGAKLSYGGGRGKEIGDHGLGIKGGVRRDSIFGSWSGRRSTQRSVAE